MIRFVGLGLVALVFLLMQSNLLPALLPPYFKPELLLLLILYLCITESFIRGALLAWGIGLLLDASGGNHFGLHAMLYLVLFIVGRRVVHALNAESPLLLLILVFCGSLVTNVLLMFFGSFAGLSEMSFLIAQRAMFQASINVIAAYLLILMIAALQRRFAPRLVVPGFAHLREERHGA